MAIIGITSIVVIIIFVPPEIRTHWFPGLATWKFLGFPIKNQNRNKMLFSPQKIWTTRLNDNSFSINPMFFSLKKRFKLERRPAGRRRTGLVVWGLCPWLDACELPRTNVGGIYLWLVVNVFFFVFLPRKTYWTQVTVFFSSLHMYLRWCWYSDVLLLKLSSRCFFGDDSVIRFAEL